MSKKLGIYDEFKYVGYWWTAEKPENKIPGTLIFDKNGITLELIGRINIDRMRFLNEFEVILGECEEGLVTLINGFEQRVKEGYIVTSFLKFNKMVFGKHISNIEEFKVSNFTLELTNLEYWLDSPLGSFESEEELLNATKIFNIYVESKGLHIESGGQIYNSQLLTRNYNPHLYLYSDQPQSIFWFEEVAIEIKNLLTILTDTPIFISSMVSRLNVMTKITYYLLPDKNYKKGKAGLCFTTLKIGNSLEKVLNNWFDTKTDNAHQLYLRNMFEEFNLSQEDIFLNYSKALESFHRDSRKDSKFVSDEQYIKIVDTMIESVKDIPNKDLLNKLGATLKYANEYGFQRRIKDILRELPELMRESIIGENKASDLADEFRNQRDYYTHFGDKPNHIYTLKELYNINDKLKLLLQFIILKELGIDEDRFIENFKMLYL